MSPLCSSTPSSATSQSRFAVDTPDFSILSSNGFCLILTHVYTMSLGLSSQRQILLSLYKLPILRGGQGATVCKDCGQSICSAGIWGWPHGCLQGYSWQLRDLGKENASALPRPSWPSIWNSEPIKNDNIELSHVVNPWKGLEDNKYFI